MYEWEIIFHNFAIKKILIQKLFALQVFVYIQCTSIHIREIC